MWTLTLGPAQGELWGLCLSQGRRKERLQGGVWGGDPSEGGTAGPRQQLCLAPAVSGQLRGGLGRTTRAKGRCPP